MRGYGDGRCAALNHRPHRCGWMRNLTPKETALAERGYDEVTPNAPVQGWAVPTPEAGRTITESAGVRSGRTRRQSRDCRAVRSQEPTALSGLGVRLGRYCPRTDKHSRWYCEAKRAGKEVKYIHLFASYHLLFKPIAQRQQFFNLPNNPLLLCKRRKRN